MIDPISVEHTMMFNVKSTKTSRQKPWPVICNRSSRGDDITKKPPRLVFPCPKYSFSPIFQSDAALSCCAENWYNCWRTSVTRFGWLGIEITPVSYKARVLCRLCLPSCHQLLRKKYKFRIHASALMFNGTAGESFARNPQVNGVVLYTNGKHVDANRIQSV